MSQFSCFLPLSISLSLLFGFIFIWTTNPTKCFCSDNERSQIAYVTFKDSQGAETAVLLSVILTPTPPPPPFCDFSYITCKNTSVIIIMIQGSNVFLMVWIIKDVLLWFFNDLTWRIA